MNNRPTLDFEVLTEDEIMVDEWGERVRFHLRNGYTVSVIKTNFSYGGTEGKWEAAIINRDGQIQGDVMGWLEPKNVADIVARTSKL